MSSSSIANIAEALASNGSNEPVQVFVRIRPEHLDHNINASSSVNKENALLGLNCAPAAKEAKCVHQVDDHTVRVSPPLDGAIPGMNRKAVPAVDDKMYTFDRIFPEEVSQEELYKHVSTHVKATVRGYNTTIFAYGSTGSGKSYTMTGNHAAPGIIPRAISEIFSIIETTAAQEQDVFFYVRLSYVELYNNNFRNLLEFASKELTAKDINDDGPRVGDTNGADQQDLPHYAHRTRVVERATVHPSAQRTDKIEVRESQSAGVFLAGQNLRIPVTTAQEAFQLIARGNKNRAVGSTNCNDMSSRSHAILTVHVESRLSASNPSTVSTSFDGSLYSPELRLGKMHLVDLAGSERLALSGAEGETLVETQNINLSLTAIGDVLSALSRNAMVMQQQSSGGGNSRAMALVPVPYRNSKLTHLLKDSLGGNSKTIMITTIRTSAEYYQQSAVSLMYASRAKKVRNRSLVNRNVIGDTGIHAVTSEIERLKYSLDERSNEFERLKLLQMKEASENVVLKSRLVELNKANDYEKKQLEAQMSNIIHSQAGQLASQKQKISTLQSALETELAQSQNRIAEQEKEIRWLKTALQESSKAVQQPKEQIEKMQIVVDQWQNQANLSKQELLEAHTTSESLKTEKIDLSAKLVQLQGRYEQLQAQLNEVKDELAMERSFSQLEIKKLREQNVNVAIDRDELKVNFLSSAESCRQRDVIINQFQKQLKSLEEDIAEHRATNNSSSEQTYELQAKISQLENDKSDLQSKLNNTVKDLEVRTATAIEGAANRLQAIDSKLRAEQEKSKKAESEVSRLADEISSLQALRGELENRLEVESAKMTLLEVDSASVEERRRQEAVRYQSDIDLLREQLLAAESSSKVLLDRQVSAHQEELSRSIQDNDHRLRELYEAKYKEIKVEFEGKEARLQKRIADEVGEGMQALEEKYILRIEQVERDSKSELERAVISQKKFTTQKWKSKLEALQASFVKEKDELRIQITNELESKHGDSLRAVEREREAVLYTLQQELTLAKENVTKTAAENEKLTEKLRNEIEKLESDMHQMESDLNESKERALRELQALLLQEHASQQRSLAEAARKELDECTAAHACSTKQLGDGYSEQLKQLANKHAADVASLLGSKEDDLRKEFAILQDEASKQSSALVSKLNEQLQQQADKEKISAKLLTEMKNRHAAELQKQEKELRDEIGNVKSKMQKLISDIQHDSSEAGIHKDRCIRELHVAHKAAESELRSALSSKEEEICRLREELVVAGAKHKETLTVELSGQQQLLDLHKAEVDKLRHDKREAEIRHQKELSSSLDQHITELAAQRSSLDAVHSKSFSALSEQLTAAEERYSNLVSSRAMKQAREMQLLDQQREEFEQLLRAAASDKDAHYKKVLKETTDMFETKISELEVSLDKSRASMEADAEVKEKGLKEAVCALELAVVAAEARLSQELAVKERSHSEQLTSQASDITNRLTKDISSLQCDKASLEAELKAAQYSFAAFEEETRRNMSSLRQTLDEERALIVETAAAELQRVQRHHEETSAALLVLHKAELKDARESALAAERELIEGNAAQTEALQSELLSSREETSSYYTNLLRSRLDEEDARYKALEEQLHQVQCDYEQRLGVLDNDKANSSFEHAAEVCALQNEVSGLRLEIEEGLKMRGDDIAALEDRNAQLLLTVEQERARYEDDINLLRSHLDDSKKELLERHDAALAAAKAATAVEGSEHAAALCRLHEEKVLAMQEEHRLRCDEYAALILEMKVQTAEQQAIYDCEIVKVEALKMSVAAEKSQGDGKVAELEALLKEAAIAHQQQLAATRDELLRESDERVAEIALAHQRSEEAHEQSKAELATLQQQLASSEAELKGELERGRAEIINRIVDMSSKHDAEIADLKAMHKEELRAVETGSKSAMSIEKESIAESLRSKFIAEYQKLIVDHERQLEEISSKHSAEVLAASSAVAETEKKNEDLRSSLAELVQATSQTLEQATKEYETELVASKAAYKQQQERLVAEIDSLHNQLTASIKGNESLVVELQTQLALAIDSSNREKTRFAEEISELRESLVTERQSSLSVTDLYDKKLANEIVAQRQQLEESFSAEACALRRDVKAMKDHLDAVAKENTKLQIQLSERNSANEKLLKDVIETKVRDESDFVAQLKIAVEEASREKVILQSQLNKERSKCTELEIANSIAQSAKNTAETSYRAALLERDELNRSKKEAIAQLEALQARESAPAPHRTIVTKGVTSLQRPPAATLNTSLATAPTRPVYTLAEESIAAHTRDVLIMEQERSSLQTPQGRSQQRSSRPGGALITAPAPAELDESRKAVLPWSSPVLCSSPTDQLIAAILDGDVQGLRCVVRSRGDDLTSPFWRDLASSLLPLHRAVSGLHFHGSERALISTIDALSQLHADTSAVDHAGNSALHKAIQICTSKSVVNVVQALLAKGLKANVCNKEGDTPLHTECKRVRTASVEVVEALLLAGADPNYTSPLRTNLNAPSPLLLLLLRGSAIASSTAAAASDSHSSMLHGLDSHSAEAATTAEWDDAESARQAGRRVWVRAAAVLLRSGAVWDSTWRGPSKCSQLHLLLSAFPPSKEDIDEYCGMLDGAMAAGLSPSHEDEKGRNVLFILCERLAATSSESFSESNRVLQAVIDGFPRGATAGIGSSDRTGRTIFDIRDKVPFSCLSTARHILAAASLVATSAPGKAKAHKETKMPPANRVADENVANKAAPGKTRAFGLR